MIALYKIMDQLKMITIYHRLKTQDKKENIFKEQVMITKLPCWKRSYNHRQLGFEYKNIFTYWF